MALIKCPECGKDISDKSDKCIHCGYPLEKSNGLNNEKIEFLIKSGDKVEAIKYISETLNISPGEAFQYYRKHNKVSNSVSSKPKCPHCNSTNIRPITTGSRLLSTTLFGFASRKMGKSYECLNCKYTW